MNLIALPNIASMPSGVVGPTYGLELNGTLRALRLMAKILSMMGSPINMVGQPEVGPDAATKSYVDGNLSSLYSAVSAAVDSNLKTSLKFLVKSSIDYQGGRISNLDSPVATHHPTTK